MVGWFCWAAVGFSLLLLLLWQFGWLGLGGLLFFCIVFGGWGGFVCCFGFGGDFHLFFGFLLLLFLMHIQYAIHSLDM